MKKVDIKKILSMTLAAVMLFGCMGDTAFAEAKAETGQLNRLAESESLSIDFEDGLQEWETSGSVTVVDSGGQDGKKNVLLGKNAEMTRTITGIPQGSYTLSAWVKGNTSSYSSKLTAKDTGGPDSVLRIDSYINSSSWTQMGHRNVLVYNGQLTIVIESGSASALYVDDIELRLDSNDDNPTENWDFESGLDNWTTAGDVQITDMADSGTKAAILPDGAEVAQTIAVKPNTSYIATMRAKVDKQDTYKTIDQVDNTLTGKKMGETVERTSLGNRVNLGVKTTGGTVLRQAPASTTGYALITVAFTTGASDNQVVLYANTVANQAYNDSVTLHKNGGTLLADNWSGNGGDKAYVDNFDIFEIDNDYIKGADVSYLPLLEDLDGKHFANGVQQDCLRIISNHGVNSIISKVFVHSGNYIYNSDGDLSLNYVPDLYDLSGNPIPRQQQEGYFDKEHTISLAKRATDLGMSFTPGFQYSDTWMSNSKAYTPLDWLEEDYEGNLSNAGLELLKTAVYNYVYDYLSEIKEAGVRLAGVKHGNEQNGGIVWPAGKGATSAGHIALVNASVEASKAATPEVSNYVHTNNGYSATSSDSFFGGLLNGGAKFEGMAYSLYGGRLTSQMFALMRNNMNQERFKYMDYVNVETGLNFTSYNPTPEHSMASINPTNYYSKSANGQYNWLLDYIQAPLDIPNPYGQTRGFYYWETDWLPLMGAGTAVGRVNDVSCRAMFNNGDTGIKEMGSTENGKPGDMMDSMYAYLIRGGAKNQSSGMKTPLTGDGDYAVSAAEPTGISFAKGSITLKEGEVERIKPTVAPTGAVLTDNKIRWSSSDSSVASVSEFGYVTGNNPGTATITGAVGGISNSFTVTISAATKAKTGDIVLKVGEQNVGDKETVNAKIYDKLKLQVTLPDSVTDKAVQFKSSNPEVASFFGETWQTPEGEMRQNTASAKYIQLNVNEAGSTNITITTADGEDTLTFKLDTTKVVVEEIEIEGKEHTIQNGKTLQLSASVKPEDAEFYSIIWSSDDEDIATVDKEGVVTALKPGTVTIRAASKDDESVFGECTIEVTAVTVEKIVISNTSLFLQPNQEWQLTAFVQPENVTNKDITWAVEENEYVSVDETGKVTALKAGGTAVVTVSSAADETKKAECTVTVQEEKVEAEEIHIIPDTYYFKSDYFSEIASAIDVPSEQLTVGTIPENASTTDLEWQSGDTSVITVDSMGVVTAKKSGVADLKVKNTGGKEAAAVVFVPVISESFDNRVNGDDWQLEAGAGNGFTAAVQDGKLVISGDNGDLTKVFQSVVNEKIIVDFVWDVGIPGTAGNSISIQDSEGNAYAVLQADTSGNISFGSGNRGKGLVGEGFTGTEKSYKVQIILDLEFGTYELWLEDENNSEKAIVLQANSFDMDLTYKNDISSLNISGSGASAIDEFNIYAGAPIPTGIEVSEKNVKLVPVKDTLGVSKQLVATVLPAMASQKVIWSSSDEEVATVDENGLVTATNLIDSLEEVPEDKTCTITVASSSNPNCKLEIPITVGKPSRSSEYMTITNEEGEDIAGQTVATEPGVSMILKGRVYGVDGDTEVSNLEWKSSDEKIIRIKSTDNPYQARILIIGNGEAILTLEAECYGSVMKREVYFSVSGDAALYIDDLREVLEAAEDAQQYPDEYYKDELLTAFKEKWQTARTTYTAAISESWGPEKQDEIDEVQKALSEAIAALSGKDNIPVEKIEVKVPKYPISVGKQVALETELTPYYATNQEIIWISSDEGVATVNQNGVLLAVAPGKTMIKAEAEGGGEPVEFEVEITDDLSSWYDYQGGSVSASITKKGDPKSPLVNARTMSYRDTSWSTETSFPGSLIIDLGAVANLKESYMAVWSQFKYTIEVSTNGQQWTTVIDKSGTFTGEAFSAIKQSDGSTGTRYRMTDQMPEDTYGRYVRLTVNGASGGYGGVEVFQVKGSFGEKIAMEITDPGYPISLGKTMQIQYQMASEEKPSIVWSTDDESVLTVDNQGNVKAVGVGKTTVRATIGGKESASVEIEVTDDISSWYDYQGGTVSADVTKKGAPENPLINARTMSYRDTSWSVEQSFPGTLTIDLGAVAEIKETYMAIWSPYKYVIEVSRDGQEWTQVTDQSQEFVGEAFDAVKQSDGSTSTRYWLSDEIGTGTYARYIRVKLLAASGGFGGVEVLQVKGSFVGDESEIVDKTKLRALVKDADKYLAEDYPEAAWEVFSDILVDAKGVLDLDNTDQKTIEDMISTLKDAIKTLEASVDEAAAAAVDVLIAAISESVTLEDETAIEEARKAYDQLSEEQKALVNNYDILETAEKKVEDLARVKAVEELIDAISDKVSLADQAAIEAAMKAYEELGDLKEAVNTEKIDKLSDANEAYTILKENADANTVAAVNVEGLIKKISVNVTLADETAIQAARKAYDTLTADQKKLVTNYAVLQAAEKTYATLNNTLQSNLTVAAKVVDLIKKISNPVTASDKAAIEAAEKAYAALTQDQRKLVTNYTTLTEARKSYNVINSNTQVKGVPKKSSKHVVGDFRYSVTKSAAKNGTVILVKPVNKKLKSVKIPATVKINGYVFKVTAISKKAFYKNTKIKTVVIGSNVQTIGTQAFQGCTAMTKVTIGKSMQTINKKAFYNCKKLKSVIVKSTKLKKVGSKVWTGTAKKIVIKVPKQKLSSYKRLFKGKGLASTASIKKR